MGLLVILLGRDGGGSGLVAGVCVERVCGGGRSYLLLRRPPRSRERFLSRDRDLLLPLSRDL